MGGEDTSVARGPGRGREMAVWLAIVTLCALTDHRWALPLPDAPRRLMAVLHTAWSAGAPLAATGAFLVAATATTRRWADRLCALGMFLGLGLVELALKHIGVGGRQPAQTVYLSLNPSGLLLRAQRVISAATRVIGVSGTFPSGHALRIVLISGYALRRDNRGLPLAAAVGSTILAALVGGHSWQEGLGGGALALAGLSAAGRTQAR